MKKLTLLIIIALILGVNNNSSAQIKQQSTDGYKTYPGKVTFGTCRVNQFTIQYRLYPSDTQVSVYTNVKWEGDTTANNCLSDQKFDIFLCVGTDSIPRYVYAGGTDILKVGIGNNEWGATPYLVQTKWDNLITKNFGLKESLHFFTAEEAKQIWNNGLTVKSIKIITSNRKVYTFK